MKKILLVIAALAALTLTAGAQPRQLHQPQETQQAQKRYGVKSGILKLTASADGHDTPETQYFDEYGAVESVTYIMEVPGLVSYDVWCITRDKKMWFVTVTDGKRGVKESDNPTWDLNFLSPSQEVIDKYKLQEVGEETVLGRKCKIFTYEIKQGRKTNAVKAWVYKGITLKSEMKVGRRTSTITVTEFKENAKLPAGVFNTEE
jgi:hypothetical protein